VILFSGHVMELKLWMAIHSGKSFYNLLASHFVSSGNSLYPLAIIFNLLSSLFWHFILLSYCGQTQFLWSLFLCGKTQFRWLFIFCGKIQVQWHFSLPSSSRFKKKNVFIFSAIHAYTQRRWEPLPDSKTFSFPLHFMLTTSDCGNLFQTLNHFPILCILVLPPNEFGRHHPMKLHPFNSMISFLYTA